jgi:hypothetical protein
MIDLIAAIREKLADLLGKLLLYLTRAQDGLHERPRGLQIAHARLDLAATIQ